MNQALWVAKTGLDAQQTRMTVVSNNLANVNTTGFKKGRASFEDLLYQTVRQAGAQTSTQSQSPSGLTLGTGTVLTALPQGAAAGYGSYIVGQAAKYYFEHGASWGGEAPKAVVNRILQATDKQSVLERLKAEINAKIRVNPYAGRDR